MAHCLLCLFSNMFVSTVLVTLTLAKLALSAPMPTTTSTVVWNENGCLIDSWNRALGAYQFSDDSMTKTKCLAACQERVSSVKSQWMNSYHRLTLMPGWKLVRSVSVPTGSPTANGVLVPALPPATATSLAGVIVRKTVEARFGSGHTRCQQCLL